MATLADQLVLYSFRRCPYAIRARLALFYAGIRCELREVVLKDKPQEMLDASAKGTVPVLMLHDQVIDESVDIMRWALTQADPQGWDALTLQHTLLERNDGFFKHYLDRYKYFDRYPEFSQQDYFAKACEFIDELEVALASTGQGGFLNSNELSALDIAIYPFVRQFAFVDKDQFDSLPHPNVKEWLSDFLNSELFAAVMIKYPPWHAGQKPIFFQT